MNDSKRREFWIERFGGINDTYHLHKDKPQKTIIYVDETFKVTELQPHERIFSESEIRGLVYEAVEIAEYEEFPEESIEKKLKELFATGGDDE